MHGTGQTGTFDRSCRLLTRFCGVRTAVIRLAEEDAVRLLQLGKVETGWVACRIREHAAIARRLRCLGYDHGSQGCGNPDKKNACCRCSTTGRASEAERQELKLLQLRLGRGMHAQDLLMRTARERGADVLLMSEFGWRWRMCVCIAATFLLTILTRSSRPRFSSLRKASPSS